MSDYYMGRELPGELPPGARIPDVTPPEGVVLQKIGLDGWNRKYLYQAGIGGDGTRYERKMLVAEIAPDSMEVPRTSTGIERPALPTRAPVLGMERLSGRASPVMSPSSLPLMQNGPRLGQIAPSGQGPSAAPQGPEPGACPGPIEMPDGHTVNPEDPITFKDLCTIMPYLIESLKGPQGPQGPRTGPVPLTGQAPGGATVISPPSGMFGQGGAPGGGGGMMGFGEIGRAHV